MLINLFFWLTLAVQAQDKTVRKDWNKRLDLRKYAIKRSDQEKEQFIKQVVKPTDKAYDYYFIAVLKDYDPKKATWFPIKGTPIKYKLKGIYVLDINLDGKQDLIHVPGNYGALYNSEMYFSDLFINTDKGYKQIRLSGYIIHFKRNSRKQIVEFTTFINPCCDDFARVVKFKIDYKSNKEFVTHSWAVPHNYNQ